MFLTSNDAKIGPNFYYWLLQSEESTKKVQFGTGTGLQVTVMGILWDSIRFSCLQMTVHLR